MSCEEKQVYPTDLIPAYTDFENNWDERNLFGKVEEIKWYKTVFQNAEKEGKSILNLKENFTEFGSLKETANFDRDGEIIQNDVYEYDTEETHIKTTSKNLPAKINYILSISYDTINKTRVTNVIVNDTITQNIKVFYDNKDIPSKQIAIEQNDTTEVKFHYEFNKNDKVVSELQIDENNNDTIQISRFEYDEKENIILSSNKFLGSEYITEIEWKNERIKKQTEHSILPDQIKYLNEITEYDDLYNLVNSKIYENSKINRELNYDYEFDSRGNWIKREVSMKEHFAGSKTFKPIYIETRQIKYWE